MGAKKRQEVGERIYEIRYRHADDGLDYVHHFGAGSRLIAEPDGRVTIEDTGGRRSHARRGGQRWLINPGGTTMARKTPPRNSKGRFRRGAARTRKRATRKNPPRRRSSGTPARDSRGRFKGGSSARRRSSGTRSNPPNIMDTIQRGIRGGAGVVLGKVGARALPAALNLPMAGNVGLAIQGAAGVVVGVIAGEMLPRDWADYILAGGVAAPMETWLANANIPILSPALAVGGGGVGSYLPRTRPAGLLPAGAGAMRRPGMASYPRAGGWGGGGGMTSGY